MDLSYNIEIMIVPLSVKFKVLQVELYIGWQDPVNHLEDFKAHTFSIIIPKR